MVKSRSALYCNLKLFLLFLVVYGHWIEPWLTGSPALTAQYRWIYLIHIPIFAFVSGLFIRDRRDCISLARRTVPVYLAAQAVAVLFGAAPLQPFWHLWYLLSLIFWACAAWALLRLRCAKLPVLVLAVLAGCMAGFIPWLDRTMSGSRTVVFFPYFWAGVCCKPDFPWHRYRLPSLLALLLAGVLLPEIRRIPVTFLYHATPYTHGQMAVWRLWCYAAAVLLGFFLLTWMPLRRFPWSRGGANTMPGYLLHGPIVAVLRKTALPGLLYPAATAFLLYLLYKATQWHTPLYYITERRRAPCPHSPRSISSTDRRYTGFCCR